jgi:uncharacterized protein
MRHVLVQRFGVRHKPSSSSQALASVVPFMIELLLFVAGILGGAINSLAGGGSFIVFPALLFAGVPPVIANASNTFAALPGYVSGVVGFWKDVKTERKRLLPYSIIAILFGYVGAELLLHISNEAFSDVVPFLVGFAVLLFAFGGKLNRWAQGASGRDSRLQLVGTILLYVALALVCFYGGFFNAGLGVLLLAFLSMAGLQNIHAMNGLKLWISSLVALVATLRFAFSGSIDWYHGSIAMAGVVIGGYSAARLAHLIPTSILRAAIIIYGAGLTVYFAWQTYH